MTDPRMNEHESEQVRRWLAARDEAMPAPDTDHIMHETLSRLPTTPQARARFLGRWFDRGRGARRRTADHDHPPDSDRRSRLMYSATAITAAIAITALAVNVIDTTPTQPSAGTFSTHVVAADDSGDFTTIAEAVTAAAEGDTVLVRPGSYVEAIFIDKDITLAGDGAREDIVINPPEDGPTTVYEAPGILYFEPAYALAISDAQAEVRGLTFADARGAVVINGGSPTLSDLVFKGNEYGLLIHSGSTATITDSLMDVGGIEFTDSEPLIEGNVLRDGASISGGDGGVVRDNVLTDPGNGINVSGTPLIEGNTVTRAGSVGISASSMEGDAGAPIIVDNIVSGSRHGIQVGAGWDYDPSADIDPDAARPIVTGNDISAELNALSVNATDATISDNTVHHSWNGIVLVGGGSADVMGNEIDVDGFGIDIGANTSPSVDGNSVCGGSGSIKIHETATPSMGENTTCDGA